jgi:hypothetical protein
MLPMDNSKAEKRNADNEANKPTFKYQMPQAETFSGDKLIIAQMPFASTHLPIFF